VTDSTRPGSLLGRRLGKKEKKEERKKLINKRKKLIIKMLPSTPPHTHHAGYAAGPMPTPATHLAQVVPLGVGLAFLPRDGGYIHQAAPQELLCPHCLGEAAAKGCVHIPACKPLLSKKVVSDCISLGMYVAFGA
jgi:hypothetical protein